MNIDYWINIKWTKDKLIKAGIKSALGGNATMQKFFLERMDNSDISIQGRTPLEMMDFLIKQANMKGMSPEAVQAHLKLIKAFGEAYEIDDLEKRIKKMEKSYKKNNKKRRM